jgi:hypothetical protein
VGLRVEGIDLGVAEGGRDVSYECHFFGNLLLLILRGVMTGCVGGSIGGVALANDTESETTLLLVWGCVVGIGCGGSFLCGFFLSPEI